MDSIEDTQSISNTDGATMSVYLVASPDMKSISGKFSVEKKTVLSKELIYNVEASKKFLGTSEDLAKDFLN